MSYEDDDEISGEPDLDDLDDAPGYPSDDDDDDLEYPEPGAGPSYEDEDALENMDEPAPFDDDDEDTELPEKTYQDGTKEVKPKKPTAEDKEKPRKGNIHAENRVLKRENRDKDRENRELKRKLDLILSKLDERDQPEPEPEDEIPAESDDPIGHQAAISRKLLKKMEEQEKMAAFKAQQDAFQNELNESKKAIGEFVGKNIGDEEYTRAVSYLANFEVESIMDDYPDITQQDAVQLAAERAVERQIKWLRAGLNPGKQFYKRAIAAGYKRSQPPTEEPQRSKAKPTGREEIRKANARDAASRTISTATGAPARKKTTLDDVLKMNDRDLEDYFDEKAKASGGKKRSNIRISDFIEPTYR